jgi:hypothetical protein
MLDEFFRYLEYHGCNIERQTRSNGFDAMITGRSRGRLVYFAGATPSVFTAVPENTAVLSLNGFADAPRKSTNTMWLDVNSKSRSGSCEVGEELALFLSRYGVRFYRLD